MAERDDMVAKLMAMLEAQGAQLRALTIAATKPQQPTITIAALFEEYEKARQHDRSWKHNRNRLRHLVRRLGSLPAAQLTEMMWAEHRGARAREPFHEDCDGVQKFPTPQTLTLEFQRAKEMLKFGVRQGLLDKNPLADAKPEKAISERETWLDEAGIDQLLTGISAIDSERGRLLMKAFILLCVDGMLRFNEARHVRRDRIHDGVLELAAKQTKSKKRRLVGLTPRVLEAIAEVPPVVGDQRVFVNPATGELYSETRFRDWFEIVKSASGIDALAVDGETVVIHTLRHSGASIADSLGAAATAIRDGLGHSTLATTEKYLHRHRKAGARDLARLMERADQDRRGPHRASEDVVHGRTDNSRSETVK